jgi:splicing factor 3B subunit 2
MSDTRFGDVEIEYVPEAPPEDALTDDFAHIFKKFSLLQAVKDDVVESKDESLAVVSRDGAENEENQDRTLKETNKESDAADKKPSKRKLKQMTRMSVAELKQKVARPELVELHDITARDPVFLLHLKSTKNSVPVPRHWSSKRRYLQGKRGYEKPPFLLPDFIRQTGIMEMRDSIQDKESGKSLKAKTRERVQPKMGKIQMDYQQLHDAFFKWQTKPKLSIHGDLYYEGKEFERKFKYKPGELSNELRKALGMPVGPNANRYPPPWLAAMRRHGPPPSYPYLKIPGLNCPFPDGCNDSNDDNQSGADAEMNESDGDD